MDDIFETKASQQIIIFEKNINSCVTFFIIHLVANEIFPKFVLLESF